ncbi:MAG: hypothetical protein H5U05_03285 [Candidatus Aminicenantes bacterium]|nr:hypothetical protein [Candidatus Aminicenantes bacterium]
MDKPSKSKVLISFLGTGNYQKVKYQLNGQSYESDLSILPINDYFKPDKIYIIGTRDSRWELVANLNYERLEIPAGKSADEFWQMFDLLLQNISISESEVAFDITHCFRSIPFFVIIFIKFIKFMKKSIEVSHIFYGILDQKTNESQIIDLRPLSDLLDWMEAIASLKKYGDLDDLCLLTERAEKQIRKQGIKQPLKLANLKRELKELTDITKMTYVPQLGEISGVLTQLLDDETLRQETNVYLKPLSLLLPELKEMIGRFKKPTEWEAQLEAAKWYLENKKPSQALLVLREAIVTYVCLASGMDPYEKERREEVEKKLGEAVKSKSQDPLHKLWDKVTQLRNKVAHALMKRRENIYPDRSMRKVDELINEAEFVMKEQKHGS